jgi:hypothetical protein
MSILVAVLLAFWVGLITVSYLLIVTRGGLFEAAESSNIWVRGVELQLEKFLAGVLIYFMGTASLTVWAYFLFEGFGSFLLRWQYLLPHVLMQLGVSLLMLLAGHATLRAWPRQRLFFFGTLGAVVVVSLISLFSHGREAHLAEMHVFSTVLQLVGSLFAAVIFLISDVFPGSGAGGEENEEEKQSKKLA